MAIGNAEKANPRGNGCRADGEAARRAIGRTASAPGISFDAMLPRLGGGYRASDCGFSIAR